MFDTPNTQELQSDAVRMLALLPPETSAEVSGKLLGKADRPSPVLIRAFKHSCQPLGEKLHADMTDSAHVTILGSK